MRLESNFYKNQKGKVLEKRTLQDAIGLHIEHKSMVLYGTLNSCIKAKPQRLLLIYL